MLATVVPAAIPDLEKLFGISPSPCLVHRKVIVHTRRKPNLYGTVARRFMSRGALDTGGTAGYDSPHRRQG